MVLGVYCIELICGFFICGKSWPVLLKTERSGQTVVFCIYLKNHKMQPNSDMDKCVKHDEIYRWLNFRFNLISHVGIIACFRHIFVMCNVISFKNLHRHYWANWNHIWYECSLGNFHRTDVGMLDPWKNMAAFNKNRTKGSVRNFSHISPKLIGLAKFF